MRMLLALPMGVWNRRGAILRVLAWGVLFGIYAALGLAYFWPLDLRNVEYTHVAIAWGALVAGALQFHIGLLLLPVALVAAFTRGKRLFLAALPAILIMLGPPFLALFPRHVEPAEGPTLRVMTVNVLVINENHDALLEQVRGADPDVLLIQEYTPRWHDYLMRALEEDYPHRFMLPRWDAGGQAVFSKFAFRSPPWANVAPGLRDRPQVRVTLDVAGREVAVYGLHPRSPQRHWAVTDLRITMGELIEALEGERLPHVVAGDFNFTHNTALHRRMRRLGLTDAHDAAGRGQHLTWHPPHPALQWVPGLRLDHVYYSEHFRATHCEVGEGFGSDHRAVVADLVLVK